MRPSHFSGQLAAHGQPIHGSLHLKWQQFSVRLTHEDLASGFGWPVQPFGHCAHEALPGSAANVFLPHALHFELPRPPAALPAGHAVHAAAELHPGPLCHPAGHWAHVLQRASGSLQPGHLCGRPS